MVTGDDRYANILVDPDPFFEDWLTASTITSGISPASMEEPEEVVEPPAAATMEENCGITIVASDDDDDDDSSALSFSIQVHPNVHSGGVRNDTFANGDDWTAASSITASSAAANPSFRSQETNQEDHTILLSSVTPPRIMGPSWNHSPYYLVGGAFAFPTSMTLPVVVTGGHSGNVITESSSRNEEEEEDGLLSLNPSSLPSSQLDRLPSVASTTTAWSPSASSLTSAEPADSHLELINSRSEDSTASSDGRRSFQEQQQGDIYLNSDEEWEAWRNEMLSILTVLAEQRDHPLQGRDADELLAELLTQQEDLWNQNVQRKTFRSRLWQCCGMALAGALATVAMTSRRAGMP